MATKLTEDEASTLEAALAFIDAHYDDARARDTNKRVRNVAAAVRSNRKRRNEVLELRALVQTLETQRDTLTKQSTFHKIRTTTERHSDIHARATLETATAEAARLSASRALNSRLRAALEQQRSVGAALARVLQKPLEQKCVQELLKETSVSTIAPVTATGRHDNRHALFQDLHARLKAFSAEVNSALAVATRETVLAESHTRKFRHATLGPAAEVVASSHIPCDVADGWAFMTSTQCKAQVSMRHCRDYAYRAEMRPNLEFGVSEKDFSMEFGDPGGRVAIDGVALVESYEGTDWKLTAWASVVTTMRDDNHVRVRMRGFSAMTQSAPGRCLFHSRCEVFAGTTPSPATTFLANSMLQKARRDRHNIEEALAMRFGSDASALFV